MAWKLFHVEQMYPSPIKKSSLALLWNMPTKKASVIPDFIANCGMARVFAYFMERKVFMTDEAIFNDISITLKNAIQRTFEESNDKKYISSHAFEIALKQLL